jgi:hypothetical protein
MMSHFCLKWVGEDGQCGNGGEPSSPGDVGEDGIGARMVSLRGCDDDNELTPTEAQHPKLSSKTHS